ncbi:MAG: glycerophosphodiester phosphodiesterase family protein [Candidatus Ratteibacteria bacterium]
MSQGFLIHTWTPNSKEDIEKVISYGVHFITTDRPDICLSLLKKVK